jgi:integrase
MTTRHEVPNLARRGNVFYWRARVPVRFTACPPRARITVPLRQSDHLKACYLARRLNLLLDSLLLSPAAAMTPKEQLDAIFRAEVERMTATLDDVALVARRFGRVDDVEEVETDIEVGWANRLLQLYGTARSLAFDERCPGRALLARHDIPAAYIDAIAATYRSEQEGLRSPVFDRQIRDELARVGLPDTIASRERAKVEYFKARADVLLDVAPRWPLVDRASTPLTRSVLTDEERAALPPIVDVADTASVTGPPDIAAQPVAEASRFSADQAGPVPVVPPTGGSKPTEAEASVIQPAGELNTLSTADAQRRSPEEKDTGSAAREAASAAAPQVPAAPQPVGPSGEAIRALPISEFKAQVDELTRNKGAAWTKATANDARALITMFQGILEEEGVEDTSQIRQQHLAALRAHFNLIPSGYGQSSRLRALKPAALRAFAESMLEEEKLDPEDVGLSAATIRKHLGNLDTFLHHLIGQGYPIAPWTLKSLRPKKPKLGEVRLRQVKPGPDFLRPMFDLPIFKGCAGEGDVGRSGPVTIHSALFFIPMLYTYLGARRAELAGLAVDDVVETPFGPALFIRENAFRRLKNPQSQRHLPVPDEVVRLGFLGYVAALRSLGYQALFPELYSPFKVEQDPGDRFYKQFVPLLKEDAILGDRIWSRTIHALRHGFADTLYQAGVDSAVVSDIAGRLGDSETTTRYTNPAGLAKVKAAIAHYPIITEHLEAKPLRLLGHVERNEPPPWAGRKPVERLRRAGS